MLKDICPGAGDTFGTEFGVLGTLVLFSADDCATGKELWVSDGTAAGSLRVKDINTGAYSSQPENMVVVAGQLFFNAYNGTQTQIWKSNGTEAGTSSTGLFGTPLVAFGNTLIYTAYEASVCKLKSLNTSNNAITDLAAICPSSSEIAAGSALFYFVASNSANGQEVWRSDGTAAGSFLLKDIRPGSADSRPSGLTVNSLSQLIFSANDGINGQELWKSDGSTANTSMIKDINPTGSSDPRNITLWNNSIYFTAYDGAQVELWRSNGFAANTFVVRDLTPALAVSSSPNELTATSSALFFTATDSTHSRALFKTDGTNAGTVLIKDFSTQGQDIAMLAPFGPGIFFLGNDGEHGGEPWLSDGTEAGTAMIKDIVGSENASSRPLFAKAVQDQLLYFGYNPDSAPSGDFYALFRSDGSIAGTHVLKQFSLISQDASQAPAVFNGALYFGASNSSAANGYELWRSDARSAGTSLFADIYPGPNSSSPSWLTASGQTLFFNASNANNGKELWKTAGTPETTMLVKDIAPGNNGSYPEFLVADGGGGVYFAASDDTNGTELWYSDGTDANTRMVMNIRAGNSSSSPENLTMLGSKLIFTADDGSSGRELWISDGTLQGTRRIRDISVGTSGTSFGPYRSSFVTLGNKVFFVASSDLFGAELWASDGSEAGTQIIKDVYPGTGSSNIESLTVFNSMLFFTATADDSRRTLWSSDGSTANTRRLVTGANAPVNPEELSVMDNMLYFSAADEAAGRELWISDATASGTRMLQDMNPGAGSSNPYGMTKAGAYFYLAAYKAAAGIELWSAPMQYTGYLPLVQH